MATVIYLLDQIPFKNYNICVSNSLNLFDKPSFKEGFKKDWDNENGFDIDLRNRFKESKQITLECFIPALSMQDCINFHNTFLNEIDKKGSRRLSVIADSLRMEYQVFRTDSVEVNLEYDSHNKVGKFNLRLVENMPVKRVLRTTQKTTTITLVSNKILVIDWGDGTQRYTSPSVNTYNKTYTLTGEYFPLIMGDIDSITSFNTNATVLWNKF